MTDEMTTQQPPLETRYCSIFTFANLSANSVLSAVICVLNKCHMLQGSCGSCWAFSGIAALESKYLDLTGEAPESVDFSEQQFLDCTYEATAGIHPLHNYRNLLGKAITI